MQQNDTTVNGYIFRLVVVSGNLTHLSLPKNKLRLNIKILKKMYVECKLVSHKLLNYHVTKKLELYIS